MVKYSEVYVCFMFHVSATIIVVCLRWDTNKPSRGTNKDVPIQCISGTNQTGFQVQRLTLFRKSLQTTKEHREAKQMKMTSIKVCGAKNWRMTYRKTISVINEFVTTTWKGRMSLRRFISLRNALQNWWIKRVDWCQRKIWKLNN